MFLVPESFDFLLFVPHSGTFLPVKLLKSADRQMCSLLDDHALTQCNLGEYNCLVMLSEALRPCQDLHEFLRDLTAPQPQPLCGPAKHSCGIIANMSVAVHAPEVLGTEDLTPPAAKWLSLKALQVWLCTAC